MSAATPDETWILDDEYDHACPTCGALIEHGKKRLHADWHDMILAVARSYVDAPRVRMSGLLEPEVDIDWAAQRARQASHG